MTGFLKGNEGFLRGHGVVISRVLREVMNGVMTAVIRGVRRIMNGLDESHE